MPKLFALTEILMPDGKQVPRKAVFDATVRQAKQFDSLGAARPATEKEIKAAAEAVAVANAMDPEASQPEKPARAEKAPSSDAPGDPQAAPRGSKG